MNDQKRPKSQSRLPYGPFKKPGYGGKFGFMKDKDFYNNIISRNPDLKPQIDEVFAKYQTKKHRKPFRRLYNHKPVQISPAKDKANLEKEKLQKVKGILDTQYEYDSTKINPKAYLKRINKVTCTYLNF